MIEDAMTNSTWTSASPGHTNTIKQVNFTLTSAGDLAAGLDETLPTTAKGQEIEQNMETVDRYKRSGVDDVSRFTQDQVGNLTSMVTNPFQFIVGGLSRGLIRGVGVAALLIAIGKLIQTIFEELTQPGRAFDVRFREVAQQEVLKFTLAREQAEIRQGFRQIIVTTIGGLRGSAAIGNIGGNFYNRDVIPIDRIDPNPTGLTGPTQASEGLGSPLLSGRTTGGGAGVARARQK